MTHVNVAVCECVFRGHGREKAVECYNCRTLHESSYNNLEVDIASNLQAFCDRYCLDTQSIAAKLLYTNSYSK